MNATMKKVMTDWKQRPPECPKKNKRNVCVTYSEYMHGCMNKYGHIAS